MRDFTQIAEASRGEFTRRDLMNIMQASGEQGLLDLAQNRQEITDTVKKISGVIGTMAQITGDPDFKNNIRMMGQLRRMGADIADMEQIAKDAAMYGRAAGMNAPEALAAGGAMGQQAFAQQGLVGALGIQSGVFGLGTARQAIAGGGITNLQRAALGGEQGMAQRMAQMNASFIGNIDAMMPYLARRGEGGQLEIDRERLGRFRRGEMSLDEIIQQGAANANDPKMLQDLINGMADLKNELAKDLGPQGTFVAMVEQIRRVQKQTPGLTFESAAQVVTGNQQMAHQLTLMMRDPSFAQGMQQQMGAEIMQRQYDRDQAEIQRREQEEGFTGAWNRGTTRARRFFGIGRAGRAWEGFQEGIADWQTQRLEDERMAGVGRRITRAGGTGLIGDMTDEELGAAISGRPSIQQRRLAADAREITPGIGEHLAASTFPAYVTGVSARDIADITQAPSGAVGRRIRGGVGAEEAELLREYRAAPTVGGMISGAGEAIGLGPSDRLAKYINAIPGTQIFGGIAGAAVRSDLMDLATTAAGGDVAGQYEMTRQQMRETAEASKEAIGEDQVKAATRFRVKMAKTKGGAQLTESFENRVSQIVSNKRTGIFGGVDALRKEDVMQAARESAEEQGLSPEETREFLKQVDSDYGGAVATAALAGDPAVSQAARGAIEKEQERAGLEAIGDFEQIGTEGLAGKIEESFGLDMDDKADAQAIRILNKKSPLKAYLTTLAARQALSGDEEVKKEARAFIKASVPGADDDPKVVEKRGQLEAEYNRMVKKYSSSGADDALVEALARAGQNVALPDEAKKSWGRSALKGLITGGVPGKVLLPETTREEGYRFVSDLLGFEDEMRSAEEISKRMGDLKAAESLQARDTAVRHISAAFTKAGLDEFVVGEGEDVGEVLQARLEGLKPEEREALLNQLTKQGSAGATRLVEKAGEGGEISKKELGGFIKALAPGGLGQTVTEVGAPARMGGPDAEMQQLTTSMREWSRITTDEFGPGTKNLNTASQALLKLAQIQAEREGASDVLEDVLET